MIVLALSSFRLSFNAGIANSRWNEMFILQGSGLLGSDPTGPGSGYSLMARIFGKTAL